MRKVDFYDTVFWHEAKKDLFIYCAFLIFSPFLFRWSMHESIDLLRVLMRGFAGFGFLYVSVATVEIAKLSIGIIDKDPRTRNPLSGLQEITIRLCTPLLYGLLFWALL